MLIDNTKSMVTCLHLKLDDILKANGCNRIVPCTNLQHNLSSVFFLFSNFFNVSSLVHDVYKIIQSHCLC